MIWPAAQDFLRPIKLFRQHGADQHMWPDRVSKSQKKIGRLARLVGEPIGAADHTGDGPAFVPPGAQAGREIRAGQIAPAFVQYDTHGAVGQTRLNALPLVSSVAALASVDFDEVRLWPDTV